MMKKVTVTYGEVLLTGLLVGAVAWAISGHITSIDSTETISELSAGAERSSQANFNLYRQLHDLEIEHILLIEASAHAAGVLAGQLPQVSQNEYAEYIESFNEILTTLRSIDNNYTRTVEISGKCE